ncbi:phosphoglycolate phosphatase [Gammaproteobacteria bacterium 42_54_T18]|nr:phosphoglycolate phosphatase [Gammaproteobacteria bacterium 42_54_T18]
MSKPLTGPIEAVLFDLDGTLIDTAPDFVKVVNLLRQEDNLPPIAAALVRAQVSNGARALITLAFDLKEGEAGFAEKLQQLLDLYFSHLAKESALFDGLDELLITLEQQGIPWGIVTNKPRRYTEPLLDGLNLAKRCAVVICPDDVTHKKPHPEPLLMACEAINATPQKTLYVGDHIRDIASGNSAQNSTIAVSWGYIDEGEDLSLWNADHIVHTSEELLQLLVSTYNVRPAGENNHA